MIYLLGAAALVAWFAIGIGAFIKWADGARLFIPIALLWTILTIAATPSLGSTGRPDERLRR